MQASDGHIQDVSVQIRAGKCNSKSVKQPLKIGKFLQLFRFKAFQQVYFCVDRISKFFPVKCKTFRANKCNWKSEFKKIAQNWQMFAMISD